MKDNSHQIELFAQGLVENLSPPSRRALARKLVKTLRASQAKRIAANVNPDGTKHTPRKKQHSKQGRIRRRAMFQKIKLNRHIKAQSNANGLSIQFSKQTARIAAEHHFGLRGKVNRIRNITHQYAERQLLGFSRDDKAVMEDQIIDHLAAD